MWRTVFSVCAIPDRRPSLRRDQRPGQMGFSPSWTTTSPTVYFQESRVAVQHPFPMVDYYNVVPRHLSSNSIIALNFLLFWRRRYNDILRSTLHHYNVDSPPALRHIFSRPNSSALNKLHPGSSYYQRQCNMMFYLKCYVNTLSNNDKDLYFSRLL